MIMSTRVFVLNPRIFAEHLANMMSYGLGQITATLLLLLGGGLYWHLLCYKLFGNI